MPDDNPLPENPPSPESRRRTFTVRDGMILVAAAAVGAWGYRSHLTALRETGFVDYGRMEGWAILAGPVLGALTISLILSRWLPLRPSRIELFRQPGFVALFVATILTARRFLEAQFEVWMVGVDDWILIEEWPKAIQEAAVGIVLAWSMLALAGCLKAERGWIDRSARAVGLLWILAGICCWFVPLLEELAHQNAERLQ